MAVVHQIWIKRAHGGKMDAAERATLVAGRGIAGNADQRGKRQVTLIDLQTWRALMERLDGDLETSARRANVVIEGISLPHTRGKTLLIGDTRLLIHGETRPCGQMDQALPGLRTAMQDEWGGGVFAEVIDGGEIAVGDPVSWGQPRD